MQRLLLSDCVVLRSNWESMLRTVGVQERHITAIRDRADELLHPFRVATKEGCDWNAHISPVCVAISQYINNNLSTDKPTGSTAPTPAASKRGRPSSSDRRTSDAAQADLNASIAFRKKQAEADAEIAILKLKHATMDVKSEERTLQALYDGIASGDTKHTFKMRRRLRLTAGGEPEAFRMLLRWLEPRAEDEGIYGKILDHVEAVMDAATPLEMALALDNINGEMGKYTLDGELIAPQPPYDED
jgi:hypothetical protein